MCQYLILKRYNAAVQALLEHDETPHTAVAVLERVNLLEADVQVEDVLQRVLLYGIIPL